MNRAARTWAPGDYLRHRFNPELGVGRVVRTEGRVLTVVFARPGTELRLAASTDALMPVDLTAGRPVRIVATHEASVVAGRLPDGRLRLADGRLVEAHELWPLSLDSPLVERLAMGELDEVEDFLIRVDMLHLLALREAGGLGSFLGGRVRLFPHQLYVAERATAGATAPVRWLLADEVGLGKTIEAALILNRLVHTGQVERCVVVVPEALTVQWLGELWRKYHQVFTLLDDTRLTDVARDFGQHFNPFDVHRRVVVALELLVARPELTAQAVAAGIDLLVVDEAQRLRRPPGHPGEPAWRAVAPIAALGRHVLLLSATPLEDDAHGFFRLLQLLRPDEFPDGTSIEARLASGTPLPPCTSATRRSDIGGLPPRVGRPIALDEGPGWTLRHDMETALRTRARDAGNVVQQRQHLDRLRRAMASGAALAAVLGPEDHAWPQRTADMDAQDPRLAWLLVQAPRWRAAGDKTLVFVAHRETLEMLRTALSHRAQMATGVFHEALSPARRDTEVARFREADGPSLLVSTECGGEGRNFEFCRRLVLYDLPWTPATVEQRIGRLDRIGRRRPVDICYFHPPGGIGLDVVRLFERLGVFREPLGGLELQVAHVEQALEAVALNPVGTLTDAALDALVADPQAARTRIREAAYHQLHRDPYRADMAPGILARVPAELDALNEQVVTSACARLGFSLERPRGHRTWAIELGQQAFVDGLPGVPDGASFVGSFDREEAVEDESLDFFASGHPLVEGVFAYLEEAPTGRAVRFAVHMGNEQGEGLVAVYKTASGFDVVAIDASGRNRPDWAARLRERPLLARHLAVEAAGEAHWQQLARRLGALLDPARRPVALALIAVRPAMLS
ncbi:MAG: helicase-related protein [Vicinamibacterales bacterium]